MKIEATFLENKKQVAKFDGHEVMSDANKTNGGEGEYPASIILRPLSPFALVTTPESFARPAVLIFKI